MDSHATTPCARSSFSAGFGFRTRGVEAERNRRSVARVDPRAGSSGGRNRPSLWQQRPKKQSADWKAKAKLNGVSSENPTNSAAVDTETEACESNWSKDSATSSIITDPLEISGFITRVSDLIKLVDSKDITELQLKQLDFEITIRKKEAIQQPVVAAPVPQAVFPSYAPPLVPVTTPAPAPSAQVSPKVPALTSPAKPSSSSHPPLKSPMSGMLYRSPAPGEPPFVKVGDKVQKGQVVCIIEAMKLMNEIEADQSGTVAEILAEDGKPVSVDTPLLVIIP